MRTYENHEFQIPPPTDTSWLRPWRPMADASDKEWDAAHSAPPAAPETPPETAETAT